MVADIAGINIAIDTKNTKTIKNNDIYKIYDIGQKFYLNNINTSYGKEAKEYLYKRKINDDLIKEFEVGLAIKNSKALSTLLEKKGFKEKDLIDSGLIVKDERGFQQHLEEDSRKYASQGKQRGYDDLEAQHQPDGCRSTRFQRSV